jgi:hypothetical protein
MAVRADVPSPVVGGRGDVIRGVRDAGNELSEDTWLSRNFGDIGGVTVGGAGGALTAGALGNRAVRRSAIYDTLGRMGGTDTGRNFAAAAGGTAGAATESDYHNYLRQLQRPNVIQRVRNWWPYGSNRNPAYVPTPPPNSTTAQATWWDTHFNSNRPATPRTSTLTGRVARRGAGALVGAAVIPTLLRAFGVSGMERPAPRANE